MKRNAPRVNNPARLARLRDQAIKLRERVKRSTLAFHERSQACLTWWQRAFRVPLVADWAIFTKAKTLLSAFMALFGLASSKKSSLVALMVEGPVPQASRLQPRTSDIPRSRRPEMRNTNRNRRRLYAEGLEERRVLASYVWTGALGIDWGNPGNWDTNNGTVPDDAGDTAVINLATSSPALDQARIIGGMSGNGRLNLQSFTLTIDAASGSSFAGSISGTGGLIKQGSADFTLAATNTFTGSIEVNAGTLIDQNTASYRYFRFVPTKFYSASPAAFQLSEFQLTLNGVIQSGAAVTNPGGTGNAFDF